MAPADVPEQKASATGRVIENFGPSMIDGHLIGGVLGFAAFFLIAWLYRQLREREGLGLGDAKLLAGAGAWLGWAALPSVVLLAACTALGVTRVA